MAEATDEPRGAPAEDGPEPEVRTVLEAEVARLTLAGELTAAARRPLVRELTELLLSHAAVRAVELELRDVRFMNSAGMAVLVQLQRMAAPRGIEIVLVEPPGVVARPLQLSGLWRRFAIRQEEDERAERGGGPADGAADGAVPGDATGS